MKVQELNLKVNDLQPYYYVKIIDGERNAVDLTGASIVCSMENVSDGSLKIDRQSTGIVIDSDQVNNRGKFYYSWQSADTDTEGRYKIEFEVTPASGGKFTIPSNDDKEPAFVNINSSLDNT